LHKYDLILANLPIVDFKPEAEDEITVALYDPEWKLHQRLFSEGKNYIAKNGEITFTHANLQSREGSDPQDDFKKLEKLISDNGYKVAEKQQRYWMGYEWINYRVKLVA